MNKPLKRNFEVTEAKREQVPLLVGLFGPSGGGKTFSALRLASGIQEVVGGDICVIDSESRRALHYADQFKFKHMQFNAPFGSLDYLEAIRAAAKFAKTIVVDSMSHEHEGAGGYLETHESELQRLAGDDYSKRQRQNFSAWVKPSMERRALINGILQVNANMIFCFRAKEKLKIIPGKQPVELGWMPIAGEEFLFEMTTAALLTPASGGVPRWTTEFDGERSVMKLPKQFRGVLNDGKPMSEEHGRALAQWAGAGAISSQQGGAAVARETHNLEVAGSNPAPATSSSVRVTDDAPAADAPPSPAGAPNPDAVAWGLDDDGHRLFWEPDAPNILPLPYDDDPASAWQTLAKALRTLIERAPTVGMKWKWHDLNIAEIRKKSEKLADWIRQAVPNPLDDSAAAKTPATAGAEEF